jgi:hypothetical protein
LADGANSITTRRTRVRYGAKLERSAALNGGHVDSLSRVLSGGFCRAHKTGVAGQQDTTIHRKSYYWQ